MRKKAVTKKIVEKSRKKEIKKKPTTTLKPAKRTSTKKKEVKKSKTKERKITAKKIKITAKEKPKKVMAKVKVKEKPKKIAKKVVAKKEKKIPPKAIKKVEAKKVFKKPGKKVELREKAKEREKKVETKKPIRMPEEKIEAYPTIPFGALPEEYYENKITLMIVDPVKLFAFWEVREDTMSMYTGDLNVRVYDVTGIDLDRMNANSYFDLPVNNRIDSRNIDVGPEKEFVADIGIVSPYDIFITIARSNRVSTPRATISEEGLPQKLYVTGLRVGY